MPDKDPFTRAYDSMPDLITLEQARSLIALFKDDPVCTYRTTQMFVHYHRAEITTPDSRKKGSPGCGTTKNKGKAYIYKDKLCKVAQEVYNTPPSRVDRSCWLPWSEFAKMYQKKFPERSRRIPALNYWLRENRIRKLYSCWQVRNYKTQFVEYSETLYLLLH